jgi:signal transduction histidine kinase
LAETLAALGKEFSNVLTAGHPDYDVIVEGKPQALDPLVRDEVYRIAREAIGNAFRDARTTHIEAKLVYGSAQFCIRVRDDGIGIDANVLARGRREGHLGLPGMRERASTFNGEFNLWRPMGAGTEIELKVPAHSAYLPVRHRWRLPGPWSPR